MSEPKETRPSDATEPVTQPGESSGRMSSGGSLFVDDAESADELPQQPALTTSAETPTTTEPKRYNRSAPAATRSKATKREKSALRAELMAKHGIKEYTDRATGRVMFYITDDTPREVLSELRKLEN